MEDRKTIIFAPAVFNLGETTRMVEIARTLVSTYGDRYKCIFIGFSKTFSRYIKENGFDYILLDPIFTRKDEETLFKFDQGKTFRHPFQYWRVKARVAHEIEVFELLKPELVVTGTNLTVFLSARVKGIPLIYVRPFPTTRAYLSLKKNYVPNGLKNIKFVWGIIKKIILSLRWTPYSFYKTARDYNLTLPKYTIDLLDGDWNFITTHSHFVDEINFPEHYIQAGPISYKSNNKLDQHILESIENAKKNNRQIVYFSMGSSSNSRLVKKILRYFEKSNFFVIASVEKYLKRAETLSYPRNVLITDYIPNHLLIDYIDFSVIHGGEGSVQSACESGKPFIGIPLQYEQEVNIRFCEDYGNAIVLPPFSVTKKTLKASIAKIQSAKYRKAAKQLKKEFYFNGSDILATWINNYCNK